MSGDTYKSAFSSREPHTVNTALSTPISHAPIKFNPFEKLTTVMLGAFRKKGKRWLVSQTFHLKIAAATAQGKTFLLITHYDDQAMATVHLKAVHGDRYAALIDLEKETHRRQLENILAADSKYVVYSSLIPSRERTERIAAGLYKEKYWKFIQLHSRSGISPGKNLRPSMQLIFGEIFIVLKYGAETLRTRLSDIENL